MLYGVFAFFMIVLSIMGIIHMVVFEAYTYIIFPISTLVWGLYKFFKENDDEYCRRNKINPNMDMGWLIGLGDDEYYNEYNGEGYYNYYGGNRTRVNRNSHTTSRYNCNNPEYKKILPRCRRNSIVTTEKVKTK